MFTFASEQEGSKKTDTLVAGPAVQQAASTILQALQALKASAGASTHPLPPLIVQGSVAAPPDEPRSFVSLLEMLRPRLNVLEVNARASPSPWAIAREPKHNIKRKRFAKLYYALRRKVLTDGAARRILNLAICEAKERFKGRRMGHFVREMGNAMIAFEGQVNDPVCGMCGVPVEDGDDVGASMVRFGQARRAFAPGGNLNAKCVKYAQKVRGDMPAVFERIHLGALSAGFNAYKNGQRYPGLSKEAAECAALQEKVFSEHEAAALAVGVAIIVGGAKGCPRAWCNVDEDSNYQLCAEGAEGAVLRSDKEICALKGAKGSYKGVGSRRDNEDTTTVFDPTIDSALPTSAKVSGNWRNRIERLFEAAKSFQTDLAAANLEFGVTIYFVKLGRKMGNVDKLNPLVRSTEACGGKVIKRLSEKGMSMGKVDESLGCQEFKGWLEALCPPDDGAPAAPSPAPRTPAGAPVGGRRVMADLTNDTERKRSTGSSMPKPSKRARRGR